jgi:hypothetical protein
MNGMSRYSIYIVKNQSFNQMCKINGLNWCSKGREEGKERERN